MINSTNRHLCDDVARKYVSLMYMCSHFIDGTIALLVVAEVSMSTISQSHVETICTAQQWC